VCVCVCVCLHSEYFIYLIYMQICVKQYPEDLSPQSPQSPLFQYPEDYTRARESNS